MTAFVMPTVSAVTGDAAVMLLPTTMITAAVMVLNEHANLLKVMMAILLLTLKTA